MPIVRFVTLNIPAPHQEYSNKLDLSPINIVLTMKNMNKVYKLNHDPHLASLISKLYKHGVPGKVPRNASKAYSWMEEARKAEERRCGCGGRHRGGCVVGTYTRKAEKLRKLVENK